MEIMFKKKLTAVLTAATLVFSALTVPLYAMSFGVGVVGGGAFLEMLEKGILPGMENLFNNE